MPSDRPRISLLAVQHVAPDRMRARLAGRRTGRLVPVELTAEAAAFLRANARAFLLTRRRSGGPTGHPMTLRLTPEGDLLFSTYRASAKARNVAREGRASCLVTTPWDDPSPSWVLVTGPAVLLGPEANDAWRTSVGGPAVAGVGPEVASTVEARLADGKRVLLRIRPERVVGPVAVG
jgi:PPOX class probable F420-dependent enzyme